MLNDLSFDVRVDECLSSFIKNKYLLGISHHASDDEAPFQIFDSTMSTVNTIP